MKKTPSETTKSTSTEATSLTKAASIPRIAARKNSVTTDPLPQPVGGDHANIDLPLNGLVAPATYTATNSFTADNGRFGGTRQIAIPAAVTPASSQAHPKPYDWAQRTPPPSGQGWRGPVRGSGKWLAAALGIDYKTFKHRHAMGSLWVLPVGGKMVDLWTRTREDDDRLLKAAKARDTANSDEKPSS